jgi:hypothetical protein
VGQISQIYTMIAQPWAHASRGGAIYVHAALIQRQFARGTAHAAILAKTALLNTLKLNNDLYFTSVFLFIFNDDIILQFL